MQKQIQFMLMLAGIAMAGALFTALGHSRTLAFLLLGIYAIISLVGIGLGLRAGLLIARQRPPR